MSLRSSLYIEIAKKKARESYFGNANLVRKHVTEAIERDLQKTKSLEIYRFNADVHNEHSNIYNAAVSKGCGCKLCLARHRYVATKHALAWFESDYYANDLSIFHDIYLGGRESELQTEEEYFLVTQMQFKKEIKELKLRYESIRDTIAHLLEE